MINNNMRSYTFFTLGSNDSYGQPVLSDKQGFIKMAITLSSQANVDNIKYKEAAFVGLTYDKNINDSYVIQYGNEKLKVLYINTQGRYKQVFLGEYFD